MTYKPRPVEPAILATPSTPRLTPLHSTLPEEFILSSIAPVFITGSRTICKHRISSAISLKCENLAEGNERGRVNRSQIRVARLILGDIVTKLRAVAVDS